MIAYLDSSALVKRYVAERGTDETNDLTSTSAVVGTSLLSRAEVEQFEVASDGQRFLMLLPGRRTQNPGEITVTLNWPELLRPPTGAR